MTHPVACLELRGLAIGKMLAAPTHGAKLLGLSRTATLGNIEKLSSELWGFVKLAKIKLFGCGHWPWSADEAYWFASYHPYRAIRLTNFHLIIPSGILGRNIST